MHNHAKTSLQIGSDEMTKCNKNDQIRSKRIHYSCLSNTNNCKADGREKERYLQIKTKKSCRRGKHSFMQQLFVTTCPTLLLHHNLYGIKRIVCHPILLAVEGHGETDAVQTGIVLDKGRKAFRLKVLLSLHLYGMYQILLLHQEIQFAT